ncbi:hypothetical protein BS78_01G248700 [Paspalum vaginatum]|nr:hypothetical protein BS78_01G248700 [Paspalum vaginatum]
MEMGRTGNGGGNGKVLTFNDAVSGRRRNYTSRRTLTSAGTPCSLSSHLDISRDADGGGRAAPRPLPAPGLGSRRRTYADGELDVFAAERYFKGALDGDGDRKDGGVGVATHAAAVGRTAAERPADAKAVVIAKASSTRASTVSLAASSASSANSQTALFRGGRHRRRSSSRDNKCCVQVGALMRSCSGKRSVRVDGCASATKKEVPDTAEPSASRIDWYRELRMQKAALGYAGDGTSHGLVATGLPPSLNLGTTKVAAIGREVAVAPTREEEKEKAAERISASSMSRSFTLVAPVVRANNVPPAASGCVGDPGGVGVGRAAAGGGDGKDNADDDDAGSESSSDLFEIKSLMIDDCPYEPSEASIQWSVVTADASDRGDRVSARWVSGGGGRAPVPVAGRLPRDHRPVRLLAGCTSHRAVDVSAAATTTKAVPNAAAVQRRSEGFQKARNGG